MYIFSNNGLTWRNVTSPDDIPGPGEVEFPRVVVAPADLLAAFPGYTAAVEIQSLTEQITSIQGQIDSLDGGAQARCVRLGLLAVLPAGNEELVRLQALEASIAPLRAEIAPLQTQLTAAQASLAAATTPAAS